MRKFKKVVALVLAFAMILSMNSVSFAAEMTAAEKAVTLDILRGEGAGVTAEYLAKTPTRLQAAITSLRLQGLEEDALAFEGTESFKDADKVIWPGGKAILSYLKANPSAGWSGYPDGSFKPNQAIGAQEFVKVMLEALGYVQGVDFEWEDVFTFAASVGLDDISADTVMTNEQLAVGMLEALAATTKDGEVLVDKLVAAGKIDLAKAQAVGLVAMTPDTATTATAEAINLKQIVVTFDAPISEAGDEDNYDLTTDDSAVLDADSDFDLSEDGMMVTITLTDAAIQQEVVDLEIIDILDEDLLIEGIEFLDLKIPKADSAEAVGIDTIKVYFSEPMDEGLTTKANYSVEDADGDALYIKEVTAGTNDMSALVELYSDLDGDVVITVEKVEDYQGYAVPSTDLDVAAVMDTTAPVVIDYKDASPTEVTLIFDGDIEISDDDLDNYYHTNISNTASEIEVDGAELTLTFSDENEMPNGTAYVYIEEEVLNDLWDNDNAKIVVTINVVADVTAPVVVGDVDVEAQDEIRVTYDEDIVIDDAEVTLLDEDGDEADESASIALKGVDDEDVLVITFSDDIYGDYSVLIEGIEDTVGNEADDVTLAFFMDDETDPVGTDFSAKIYKEDSDTQIVKINFDEEMDATSVTTKAMYFADGVSLDDDDVTITLVDDGEAVEIEIDEDFLDLESGDKVVVGRVKDAAGNLMTTLSVELELEAAGTVAIDSVELTSDETIVLTVKDDELVEIDTEKITFAVTTTAALEFAKVKTTLNSDGETVITFTLSDALDSTDAVVTYDVAAGAGNNEYDEELVVESGTVADAAAPVVVEDGIDFVNSTSIVITFSEDLDPLTFASAGSNGFSVSGGDAEITSVVLSGDMVTLTGEDFTKDTNVSYNDAFGLTDKADNELASFSVTDELQ